MVIFKEERVGGRARVTTDDVRIGSEKAISNHLRLFLSHFQEKCWTEVIMPQMLVKDNCIPIRILVVSTP